MNIIKRFLQDDSGAVTIDWVVLTAGVVVLAVIVAPPIQTAVIAIATDIGLEIDDAGSKMKDAPD